MTRIVMLVDNIIDGDSRVQKTAASAAEMGHEVILIGRTLGEEREESKIGEARVLKLPDNYVLRPYRQRKQVPRGRLRFPLAYHSAEQVRIMNARHTARRADYRDRVASAKRLLAAGRARGRIGTLARLQLDRVLWRGTGLLHRLRSKQYVQASKYGKRTRGRLYRARTKVINRVAPRYFWRTRDGMLLDYEIVFGPVIDEFEPDLIHAHDFPMFGVAARAAGRARDRGRDVPVVNDVHEFLPGVLRNSLQWRLANISYEREYLWRADAVVTVSEELADILQQRHRLPERPTVVCNAPLRAWADLVDAPGPRLRERCGLDPDVPLIAYSGGVSERRGIRTLVAGLPALPDVHLALVVGRRDGFLESMEQLGDELGVQDRLHVVDYVRPEQVVPFLSSATIGAIPILHCTNHEISLITKYYEYMFAGLPMVVSDVRTMAAFTRSLGNGEVFPAGDVDAYVGAIKTVLADRDRYVKAYDARPGLLEENSWEHQMEQLGKVYDRLLARG